MITQSSQDWKSIESSTFGEEEDEENDNEDEDEDEEFAQTQKLIANLRNKYRSRVKQPEEEKKPNEEATYIQPINRLDSLRLNKYLSKSDEDLRVLKKKEEFDFSIPKIRVVARHPVVRRSNESLAAGVRPRLTRSIERINIEERSGDEDSMASLDYGEVVSVTGIGSNPMRPEEIERERRHLNEAFLK